MVSNPLRMCSEERAEDEVTDIEPHIPAVLLYPYLRCALAINKRSHWSKLSPVTYFALVLKPWDLQVAQSYGGMLAARIFVGVPEVCYGLAHPYPVGQF